jgi:hypothetical protein
LRASIAGPEGRRVRRFGSGAYPSLEFYELLQYVGTFFVLAPLVHAANTTGPRRMKKAAKTAAELEASIRVEMEDICDWPTDIAISVRPEGDTWKVVITHEGGVDETGRFEMIMLICDRLRSEFDLKG